MARYRKLIFSWTLSLSLFSSSSLHAGGNIGLMFMPIQTESSCVETQIALTSGTSYTYNGGCPVVRAWAVGAGGGGGGSAGASTFGAGGGAGGIAYNAFSITSGAVFTYSIGAGGTAGLGRGASTNGTAGGATSLTVGDQTMTAGGGSFGAFISGLNYVSGGSGGSPSGTREFGRSSQNGSSSEDGIVSGTASENQGNFGGGAGGGVALGSVGGSTTLGQAGGVGTDFQGLFSVLSLLSIPTGGAGQPPAANTANNAHGTNATGFGSGGGSAGSAGGRGGDGFLGGGGGGSAGNGSNVSGGVGGSGIIILQFRKDPCEASVVTPGTVCEGGAIFLGTLSSDRYMTTPGGCSNIPAGSVSGGSGATSYATSDFTPSCSGMDSLTKTWNNGTGTTFDIPGLVNYTSNPNSDSNFGSTNTANIVAISDPAQGGFHAAARYCDSLSLGGFTDWYLPNARELNLINTNKASVPGLDQSGSFYLSSTEMDGNYAWFQRFNDGFQNGFLKDTVGARVRCVRRY